MASDTELKKLNKNVELAVSMLKTYIGNSAQAKQMNEKQKEAFESIKDVAELQAEEQKKQRAFSERARDAQGKFIKKQDKSVSTFMNMSKIIPNMFKNATSGMVMGLQSFAKSVTSNLSSFFQTVKGHFLGLFGEESEWFDILGSMKDSFVGFFAMIFRRSPSWAKKQIDILKSMYKLQVKQAKMEFLEGSGAKKGGEMGVWSTLGVILFSIAAGIGAWLHQKLVLLSQLPVFKKIMKYFDKLDDIPLIGKLFKGIKWGFKWLGWPLTLILSLIDFIKGYAEAEGGTLEKIKAGLWSALEGLLEFPVSVMAWFVEGLLSWFGIEELNLKDKIMGFLKDGFGYIFDGIIYIGKEFGLWVWDTAKMLWNGLKTLGSFIANIWNAMLDGAIFVLSKMPFTEKKIAKLESLKIGEPAKAASEADTAKIAAKKEWEAKNDKRLEELKDSNIVKETQDKTWLGQVLNKIGGSSGGDVKQVPDELDNLGLSLNNIN